MSGPMNWKDSVKATALATLADSTPTFARISADAPWNWNPHDVWLTRVQPLRGLTPKSSPSEQATPTQQGSLRI